MGKTTPEATSWFTEPDPLGVNRSIVPLLIPYLLLFSITYAYLGRKYIGPYLAIAPDGTVLGLADSGTLCWVSFTVALFAGFAWLKNRRAFDALPAAILAAVCAMGFCVLGYAMRAFSLAGVCLAAVGLAGAAVVRLCFRGAMRESALVGLCSAMTASALLFVCLTAGLVSMTPPSEGPGAVSWEELSLEIREGAKALGIENVSVRLAPLPMGESASCSPIDGTLAVSAASFMAEDADGESIVSDAVAAIEEGMVQQM